MEFVKKNTKIFILCGKSGNGKTLTSDYIINHYKNKKCISISYAMYLKEYAKNILGFDITEANKPRELLQYLGVELIKAHINENLLVNRIIEDIKVYSYFFDVIIISDARFKNEIDSIKSNFDNATSIHLYGKSGSLTNKQQDHLTETALNDYKNYDYEINNNSTMEELYRKIDKVLRRSYE